MTEPVEFGVDYRDTVTGFVATATARTETIHGNVSVCLERADSDGKPEEIWLPEGRLERADQNSDPGFRVAYRT